MEKVISNKGRIQSPPPFSGAGELDFTGAALRLKKIITKTPLQRSAHLSKKYDCNIFLKREDLQVVRSYKLRGAYNMMSSLPKEQLERGVVCASAGNHAQGFAFSCKKTKCKRCCVHACNYAKSESETNTDAW